MPLPDERGRFGEFGGRFIPETLVAALEELEREYRRARLDPAFAAELEGLLARYAGRPTPLYFAERATAALGGAKLYLKREDLVHTGAHKLNNCLGQALLARRMGRRRLIAETGAGQHGVATAAAAARFGFACDIYMGRVDMERQRLNVQRMELMGARVVPVDAGQRTLKEAINEALRDWLGDPAHTNYVLGSALGPHPYPMLVRDFQAVIGREARAQILAAEGRLPDCLVACVGGGSNSLGLFHAFLDDPGVRLVGVEAGGRSGAPGDHAARFAGGRVGVLQGTRTLLLQDAGGQILATHSIAPGLDYAAVGPELAWLAQRGRIDFDRANDAAALDAFRRFAAWEGILPALESAHALAWVIANAPRLPRASVLVANLSGRGDKDLEIVAAAGRGGVP